MTGKLRKFLSRKFTAHAFGGGKKISRRPAAPLLAATAFAVALCGPAMAQDSQADTNNWRPGDVFNQYAPPQPFGPNSFLPSEPVNPFLHELIEKRIVRISGTITESTAIKAISELRMLDDHNPENRDIELRIHSTGGSVTAAFAIYDAIKNLKSDVRTVCEGTAQSMGSFLLATGTPGKREALPHCRIMIHQPWGGAQGQITNMKIQVEEGQHLKETKINIMAAYTGLDPADLAALMERDMFLSAEDAKELGLIDEIRQPLKQPPAHEEKRKVPPKFFDRHRRAASIN